MMLSNTERRSAIEGLVCELRGTSQGLEQAMREELARSPGKRRSDAAYPVTARQLDARITNLRATIATLELEAVRPQAARPA